MKRILLKIALAAALAALSSCSASRQMTGSTRAEYEMVNIGYGKVSKKDLSYSVSKVNVKDQDIVAYSNIYDYLRGKVPGLYIGPGDNPTILIRGRGTLNGSTDPLILVDGVEIKDISGINPNDVKSVEVLKDSSASIYGVRGANGVILITTKGNR